MQKRVTATWGAVALALVLSFSGKGAFGQAVTGTLLGTVQDQTGAAVPNAGVTLTNQGTGVVDKTTTGPQGYYTFPTLNPGLYTVTVSASGFETVVSRSNVVQVEQATRVDVMLRPGRVNEQVIVSGQAPLVETTTSDLGQTIDQVQLRNLPVNGRTEMLLMQLAPGTTPAAWGAGNPEDSSGAASVQPGGGGGGDYTSANGFPFEGNLYLVDGVEDVELENAYAGLQIPEDFISEMKLETSDPSAQYGTFGGMVSNITTRSGTNAFHGELFEYNRNNDWDAKDYFSHLNPPYHSNQFGGEVDGPIIRDRLFFAADLQWLRTAGGSSGIKTLPTAAARGGDLSGFDSNGAGPITNPAACQYSAAANGIANPVPCTASSSITVAGTYDTVPAQDIVPLASSFLSSSVWPLPNISGLAVNNATFVQDTDFSMPQEDARVDYAFSQHDRFFARFGYSDRTVSEPLYLGADSSPAIFMNNGNNNATNQVTNNVVGWDHIFGNNGNMINQLRIGYSRFATSQFTTAYGTDENNILGVPNGNIAAYPDTSGVAAVNISGFTGTGDPGSVPQGLGRLSNIYQFNDTFSLVRGRHSWIFGFVYNPIQARVTNPQNDPRGQFCATGDYTGNGSTGAALADWLVGALGNSGSCQGGAVARDHFFDSPNTRTADIGEFAQDNLRLSDKLTLNLGVRYDIYTHPVDTKNLQSNFVTTGTNAGEIQVASSSNRGPNVNTYYGNLAPRVGFAYTPDNGKTAIRSAFGISYFNDNFGADGGTLERNFPELEQENNDAPMSNCSTPYGVNGNPANPDSAKYSTCGSLILANGLPGNVTTGTPVYTPIVPFSVTPGGLIFSPPGFGVYQVAQNFRQDEAEAWNVSIERQLDRNMALRVAYVGTAGSHLYDDRQLNQCNPTAFGNGPTYQQLQALYGTTLYPGFPECEPYYTFPTNPGWTPTDNGSISTVDFRNSDSKSHYNAGELVLERRAGANLTFTAAYTWSKMMDNINNPLDSYDMHQYLDTVGWQRNNFPQTLTVTYVYALPFGRGQQFANSTTPLENAFVGGWSISGVTWFRSGAPMLVTASNQYLLGNSSTERANYGCPANPYNPHTIQEWIDTSCYSQPVGFIFGNAAVAEGNGYGPRYQDWDMSFSKAIHVTERMQVQLVGQFFNIFNHVNLQPPNTNESAGPGQFGVITSDFLPRQGQLGVTIMF
ncbi:MAG TPA: TonB-dependent receptor [Acidobacteriaceae bacterium]|nr:TonB-dependent receptor [Acidobacteriaceae bacterium]